ncbi:metal ABC transporter solute-binding protein, Zn/Mn family [Spirulina sp. 06S082]|uniref:metal ABC transporter solute-binding protein, Zn/Mn family n=1 Tax=Spirulina sp. 06S082 TaxID=3110248 RepID=UPI002B1EDD1A|nr:zinc ABC transporter substrate-binding protein [Spirulina sp. 06S082]MEA5467848.1 zinc ABC transporter substrate-binding protein [Spirulina sp. 06S082]
MFWVNLRKIGVGLVLLAIAGNLSCSSEREAVKPDAGESVSPPLQVVASGSILCDLTDRIAQEKISLICLMDANQDPHTYRPTPSDRKVMETADLILYGGYNIAPHLEKVVRATNTDAPKIALYEEAIPKPLMSEHHHHEEEEHNKKGEREHHHHEEEHSSQKEELEPDPHVWHDVKNAIAIVEEIKSQLIKLDPDRAEAYEENTEKYRDRLEKLHIWIQAQIATIPPQQRLLVTTHAAFNYYVNAYGLQGSEALQGVSSEETPTAARVKELAEKLKTIKVPVIFLETTASARTLETVAREAKIAIAEDKLLTGALGDKNAETGSYIGMMSANTCAIVKGLGGQCTPFPLPLQ